MASSAAESTAGTPRASIVNIAAYKFTPLGELASRRQTLRDVTARLGIKGTILLSPEGINLFLAGTRSGIDALVGELQADSQIGPLEIKESFTAEQPFGRMLVKLKREIIAFGVDGIEPAKRTSPKLPAAQLKQWLDEGRPVTLLDVRNDFEVAHGTFSGAEAIGVEHFRDFPQAVDRLPTDRRDETIVMFCTGGIRCEKAGPYMERVGFTNVLQLDGGILKYFEDCGAEHFTGECFVFDQRVTVDASLRPGGGDARGGGDH